MPKIIRSYSLSRHSSPSDIFQWSLLPEQPAARLQPQRMLRTLPPSSPLHLMPLACSWPWLQQELPQHSSRSRVWWELPHRLLLCHASCKALGTLSHFPLTSWSSRSWVMLCLGAAPSGSCFAPLNTPFASTHCCSAHQAQPPLLPLQWCKALLGWKDTWQPGRCGGSHMLSELPPWCALSRCLCRNIRLTLLCQTCCVPQCQKTESTHFSEMNVRLEDQT